jgi:lipopolysaccharide heptosyltransferase II
VNTPVPEPLRLLVRGVNWLGDAVMTTPALQRLREHFSGAHITLLTHQKLAEVWQAHPSLDAVITFAQGESPWSIARRLRQEQFQTALIFPNSPRSAFEAWAARIPIRIGYARPWRSWSLTLAVQDRPQRIAMRKLTAAEVRRLCRTGRKPCAASSPNTPGATHQTREYLHLAAALGASPEPLPPRLAIATEEVQAASMNFGLDAAGRMFVGLNPGAEYGPAKRWPLQRFAAVAREIGPRLGCAFLIFGGRSDIPMARELEAGLSRASVPVLNLAGRTSLRELCALLKLCRVLLTNDTGPMHVAAALGTPVVVPFGSTSPELTGPGLPGDPNQRLLKSNAPCSPCFRRTCPIDLRCMNGIGVREVTAAVLDYAAGRGAGGK